MAYDYTLSGRGASVDARDIEDFKKIPLRKLKKILASDCSTGFQKSMEYSLRKAGKLSKIKKEAPKKEFQKIEMSLNEAMTFLNKIYLLNKNVKKKGYTEEILEECFYCGSTVEEADARGWDCPCHDWRSCRFSTTTVDYAIRDEEYAKKTAYIKTLIAGIRQNNLPIKFWKNKDTSGKPVVYFQYEGKQVSFHDPKNQISIPHHSWGWSKTPNKTLPFWHVA